MKTHGLIVADNGRQHVRDGDHGPAPWSNRRILEVPPSHSLHVTPTSR